MLESWTAAGRSVSIVNGTNYTPPKPQAQSVSKSVGGKNKKALINPNQTIVRDVNAFLLQTDRGTTVVADLEWRRVAVRRQSMGRANLSFVVPGISEAIDVYQITPGGLRPPHKRQRVTGGVRITLDEFSMTDMIVLTQDPLVGSTLGERIRQIGRRSTELERKERKKKCNW